MEMILAAIEVAKNTSSTDVLDGLSTPGTGLVVWYLLNNRLKDIETKTTATASQMGQCLGRMDEMQADYKALHASKNDMINRQSKFENEITKEVTTVKTENDTRYTVLKDLFKGKEVE